MSRSPAPVAGPHVDGHGRRRPGRRPAASLLCLPVLFTAAMTLGDTSNGLMMLRLYRTAEEDPARKIDDNLLITGVSILSGLAVGAIASATLATELLGLRAGLLAGLASADTTRAGWVLAGFFALVGLSTLLLWRRGRLA